MKFKHKLKTARKRMNFSRRQLAERSGLSHRTIESYEQGKMEPTFDSAAKLAEALKIEPIELIRELKVYKELDRFL